MTKAGRASRSGAFVACLAAYGCVWAVGTASEVADCTAESLKRRGTSAASARQDLTNWETRKLAVAVECYGEAHEKYPGPTPGLVGKEWLLEVLTDLEHFPAVDVWGSPFQYWSDGDHYVVISFSSGGTADHDYSEILSGQWEEAQRVICGGRTQDVARDIVFADGNHCQWYDEDGK